MGCSYFLWDRLQEFHYVQIPMDLEPRTIPIVSLPKCLINVLRFMLSLLKLILRSKSITQQYRLNCRHTNITNTLYQLSHFYNCRGKKGVPWIEPIAHELGQFRIDCVDSEWISPNCVYFAWISYEFCRFCMYFPDFV